MQRLAEAAEELGKGLRQGSALGTHGRPGSPQGQPLALREAGLRANRSPGLPPPQAGTGFLCLATPPTTVLALGEHPGN